jgi:hypothetical protein
MLWKLVKAGEDRPLSAADLALLMRLRFALQEYEAAVPMRSQIKPANNLLTAPKNTCEAHRGKAPQGAAFQS